MAEKQSSKDRIKEITAGIEEGIKNLFESEKYRKYLTTMSRFHRYSLNNIMLIHSQRPDATLVAGFNKWKNQFGRHVRKGEKGIDILAPTPYKIKVDQKKLDPDTQLPILDADGNAITEEKEISIPRFKVVKVFDVSQTDGKPLPQLASDLTGNVQNYEIFLEALRRTSPVPIGFRHLDDGSDGFFSLDTQSITIREGMSEVQTVSAIVHEIAHSILHNIKPYGKLDTSYTFEEAELSGKPALFLDARVEESVIPDGLYRYEMKASEEGLPDVVGLSIQENFLGTVITASPIELTDGFASAKDIFVNFEGNKTIKEFFEKIHPDAVEKSRNTEEVEAESISFAVCAYYGIATGENSFGYIANWSKGKELKELRDSLETINKTSSELITSIDHHYAEITKEQEAERAASESAITEAIYHLEDQQYLHLQFSDSGGWDFTLYDAASLKLIDGGLLDDPDIGIIDARNSILESMDLEPAYINTIPEEEMPELLEKLRDTAMAALPPLGPVEEIQPPVQENPDPYVTITEMNAFGYTQPDMYPVCTDFALALIDRDIPVYMLFKDNTEAMAFDSEDLAMHVGMFGIEKADWDLVKDNPDILALQEQFRVSYRWERGFQERMDNTYGIYQLKHEDSTTDLRFMNYSYLEGQGLTPKLDNYDLVYFGTFTPAESQARTLEQLYTTFNINHPEDFRGHSLSVSDVVVLNQHGQTTCHYVDSIGFKEIPGFLKQENYLKTAEMQMEDDFGMIDGIINNGKSPAQEDETKKKKPSIRDQLKAKNDQPRQKKTNKKSKEEISL